MKYLDRKKIKIIKQMKNNLKGKTADENDL